MYTLYYLPGACSLAVHTVLIELGLPFKLENVSVPLGQPRPEAYLKLNPRGSVPTLVKDSFVLREAAAIFHFILESEDNHLLPKQGTERAKVQEWLSFANATIHPLYSRLFAMHRQFGADESVKNPFYSTTVASIQKCWDEIEEVLKSGAYLAGNQISVADILTAVIANWSPAIKIPIIFGPLTQAYFKNVSSRPAFQQALATEGVSYKV